MSKRLLAASLLFVLAAVACGSGPAEQLHKTLGTLDRTASRPHDFTYEDDTLDGSQKITVQGRVSDDFLYGGTVSLNGKQLYEMIVSDDGVALKIIDTATAKNVINFAKAEDAVTGDALAAGKWVVDYTAAPPLTVAAAQPQSTAGSGTTAALANQQDQIGNDPFFDAADALHYAERNMTVGGNVVEFNPEDINYNPADDPWASDAKANLRNKGIRRFDLTQPPLPTRAGRGEVQKLPTLSDFRKMSLYVKGDRTIKVREQISIADRKEFRRAGTGRAAKYYLALRDAAELGAVSSPLRERMMSYTVKPYVGGALALPVDAVRGILKDVIGAQGLQTLFKFKEIGGTTTPGLIPGVPSGTTVTTTPGPSGTPSAKPAASPAASAKP
jgi:hypothetical protein